MKTIQTSLTGLNAVSGMTGVQTSVLLALPTNVIDLKPPTEKFFLLINGLKGVKAIHQGAREQGLQHFEAKNKCFSSFGKRLEQ